MPWPHAPGKKWPPLCQAAAALVPTYDLTRDSETGPSFGC
jgi:hypothetical protein